MVRSCRVFQMLVLASVVAFATSTPCLAQSSRHVTAEAELLLQNMSGVLASTQRLQFDATLQVNTRAEGMAMQTSSTYVLAVARPRKVGIIGRTGVYSSTLVTDGTTLTKVNQAQYQATQGAASETAEDILGQVAGGVDVWYPEPVAFLACFLRENPYEALISAARMVELGRTELIDGRQLQQVKFTGRTVDFELWLPVDGVPYPARATSNLHPVFAGNTKNPRQKAMVAEAVLEFSNWQSNDGVPDSLFTVPLPSGIEVVAAGEETGEGGSDLLGRPAPPFKASLLTGDEIDISALNGKVVVLDFWASWCGPCREGLPVLAKLTAPLKEKGVEFFAVNVREERGDIEKFLATTKLTAPVLLDPEGKISDEYGVSGIPQTVLIGRDGTVQVVHVGFGPGTEKQMQAELEDLLAGKALATTATTPRKPRPVAVEKEEQDEETTDTEKPTLPDTRTSQGLQTQWSVPGTWMAVATTDQGKVFASDQKGQVYTFGPDGRPGLAFKMGQAASALRSFRLAGGKQGLLAFQGGGRHLMAFGVDGTEQWVHPVVDGIADVQVAELDGDAVDEVLLTTKASSSVVALTSTGKQLWKVDNLKRPTTAVGALVDGQLTVLASAGDGKLYVADAEATQPRRFDPKVFAQLVRAVPDTSPTLVIVSGTTKEGEGVACVTLDGKRKWIAPVAAATKTTVDALVVSPDGKYVAAAVRGGGVHVLRVADGKVIATAAEQGLRPEFTWGKSAAGAPLLLIAGSGGLQALLPLDD